MIRQISAEKHRTVYQKLPLPLPTILHKQFFSVYYLVISVFELESISKSNTKSFVSSVPFLLPTAHTNFVSFARILHTTPPEPPLSNDTRFLINSPVRTSHSFTVPSSEDVITKRLLNCRQVTAD